MIFSNLLNNANILNYLIIISLFSLCNLKCKFCFLEHNTILSLSLLYKILLSLNKVINLLNQYNIKNVYICLCGGLLFNDKYKNFYLYIYKTFILHLKLKILTNTKVKNLYITCLSNGIFLKYNRILEFLQSTNINIGFSYDPVYRYSNKKQYNTLINNINLFKLYLSGISITLTKPNILYYIKNNDKILKKENIDINFYYPNKNWKVFLPSDIDLYNFFIYCIKNKLLNIDYIKMLILSAFNLYNIKFCTCKYIIQYINGLWTHNCIKRLSSLLQLNFYLQYTNKITLQNCTDIKNMLSLNKRNCLTCKYYRNCIMLCPGITIFKYNKINTNYCPLRLSYNYLEEHKLLFEKYFK